MVSTSEDSNNKILRIHNARQTDKTKGVMVLQEYKE